MELLKVKSATSNGYSDEVSVEGTGMEATLNDLAEILIDNIFTSVFLRLRSGMMPHDEILFSAHRISPQASIWLTLARLKFRLPE